MLGRSRSIAFTFLSASIALSACGGTGDEAAAQAVQPPVVVEAEPAAPARAPITFASCSLETGGTDRRAECAQIEVPLDWSARGPEAKKVSFFVKRLVGAAAGPHAQLWLLQGGPGGAGDGLEGLANALSKDASLGSFDIYIPDHRGTGRSAYLDCPEAKKFPPFDFAACADEAEKTWGKEGFATFTTTTAARDVGDTIERLRTPGQGVHVYGVSYGTYWAQRYLQLYPTQPSAVTLDSMCGPGLCNYLTIGYWFDRVGKKLMGDCAADTTCREKLGADPVAKTAEAVAIADARTCSGLRGMTGAMLRQVLTWFVASFELRDLVPAVVARTVRCNEDDVTALAAFVSNVRQMTGGGFGPEPEELSSDVLGFHIAFSEMMPSPMITRAQLAKMYEGAVFAKDDPSLYDAYEAWPKYARDEHVGQYPSTATPMLLLNGTLDPQTPQELGEEVASHYRGPSQSFVLLPRAAHGTLHQSPVSTRSSDDACGMIVWKQFLGGPTRVLDTSCTARILPHDFSDTQPLAKSFFGVASLWGSPARGVAPGGVPVAPAHVRAELTRAMRATRPWLPISLQRLELARAFADELGATR